MLRRYSWETEPQPGDGPSIATTSDNITMAPSQNHDPRASQTPPLPHPYYHYRHLNRHTHLHNSPSSPESQSPVSFYSFEFEDAPTQQTFHDIPLGGNGYVDTTPQSTRHAYHDASTDTPRPESLGVSESFNFYSSHEDFDPTSHGAMPAHSSGTPAGDPPTTIETRVPSDTEGLTPNQKPPGGGPNKNYKPKSLRFWLIMLSNFLAIFLVALDRTIIATAIPRITDDFKSLGDIGWYGSAYMLTTAASQLLFGRIYKFYDIKW